MKALEIINEGSSCETYRGDAPAAMRYLGIDAGAETIKLIELSGADGQLVVTRRKMLEHHKNPGTALLASLKAWDWDSVAGAAITGRFAGQVRIPRIPTKQAQAKGYHYLFGEEPGTIINIGSHGFSVLELRRNGLAIFRENSRCSQGTGNFLRQLVERFSLTIDEASLLCADVSEPASLSGRCPVILKTDMTHLANKGEDRARILAGLFDAVCENVLVLLKPGASPERVVLTGGVTQSPRVRRVMAESVTKLGMTLIDHEAEDLLYLDAIGSALLASQSNQELPDLQDLLMPPRRLNLERLPALKASLPQVRRMPPQTMPAFTSKSRRIVLGLDIGSTGSKAVALDNSTSEVVWEGYRQTLGDPVGAAQDLLKRFADSPAGAQPVIAFGATGSGREVAGSLLTSCFGKNSVFIVNEIVAHATGALHFDPTVDTIFEIGGQDAKYIRLAEGRIVDCAMNEACSAGTGSFIEEQGRKFARIDDVKQLGQAALTAGEGVSLGQHCSVFMAEIIDEAVACGIQAPAIISGLYDSIIKNYLNRVKGSRSIGKVIFCQGMPFAADALAAAVARQTGSEVVIPPNPGTVGALGIALLASRELEACKSGNAPALELGRFLSAKVEQKDSFQCRAVIGCGGAGNKCRIERLKTVVRERHSSFTWGGGCALHDKASRKRKLPNLAPDPFREREELLLRLTEPFLTRRGRPVIALSNEFMLKGLFPFYVAFFSESGFDLEVIDGADQAMLKRGVQTANVPYCAPMQLFHGVVDRMTKVRADWLFVPMLRSVPAADGQRCSVVCPVVQAAPDLCRWTQNRGGTTGPKLLSVEIKFGKGNFGSSEFQASCAELGRALRLPPAQARRAWKTGVRLQAQFDDGCARLVENALQFCRENQITPIVVLGRNYAIYNKTLNSNVPAILREQGAIAIPVEHYPVAGTVPLFNQVYWGYAQGILRAAHQIRRTPGVYALYCSNYSCGPDSFNLHFAAHIMEGKPFAIIETDGHSGDAGTKTRIEAFLQCVEEDRRAAKSSAGLNDFGALGSSNFKLRDLRCNHDVNERLLVPNLGAASLAVAAVFRGLGFQAEGLPSPDSESLRLGRRYTSGKECLPMPLTLGSLLQRLNAASPGERFIYLMPRTDGPCRFGAYNLLNHIVLDRLGWRDRVRIWSPKDTGYFDDVPAGTEMLMLAGIVGTDLLKQALCDLRPLERSPGKAQALYDQYLSELLATLESAGRSDLNLPASLWEVATQNLFGVTKLLRRAAEQFVQLRVDRPIPTVELTGEIYVKAVDFSNDFLIQKLEERGLRVRPAPQTEWLDYCGYIRRRREGRNRLVDCLSERVQHRIEAIGLAAMAPNLGWPMPPTIEESLAAAQPYINASLEGEAVLTVGSSLEAWHRHQVDAVVSVGPLECMPTKIAEAQFHHIAEKDGLLTLTLPFNGEPVSTTVLDNFAFEVHSRFQKKSASKPHTFARKRTSVLARALSMLPEL